MRFRKTLGPLMLEIGLVLTLSAWAQDKPFTMEEVVNMVRAGLGNDSGTRLIMQRGIDFTPTQDFLRNLKSAGAKEVFLKALVANKPLSQEQVDHMVRAGLGEESGAQMITRRGIDFVPTENYIETLKSAGAKEVFLEALRGRMPLNQVSTSGSMTASITDLQKAQVAAQEGAGDAAAQQGKSREALQHYLTALQGLPDNPPANVEQPLREKIVKFVAQLSPPPAVPQDAIRHAAYAQAAVEDAEKDANTSHLDDAVSELQKALRIAPWWAEAYFNLGAVLKKANRPGEAAQALQLYLLADPHAQNAQDVQMEIYKLQYEANRPQRKAAPPNPRGLSKNEIIQLLANRVSSARLVEIVKDHGIKFSPTADDLKDIRAEGGNDQLIQAIQQAAVPLN